MRSHDALPSAHIKETPRPFDVFKVYSLAFRVTCPLFSFFPIEFSHLRMTLIPKQLAFVDDDSDLPMGENNEI